MNLKKITDQKLYENLKALVGSERAPDRNYSSYCRDREKEIIFKYRVFQFV